MAQSQRLLKNARRQSTEDSIDDSDTEESGSDDWQPQSSGTIRVGRDTAPVSSPSNMSGRPRRAAAAPANNPLSSSVTVSRSNTPEERRRSIKLTVKLPSSKLREVVTERDVKGVKAFNTEGKYWANKPEGHLRRRTQKSYKIPDPSSDEEEEDDDETGEDEVDELMNDVDEAGAETEGSEEEDAEGDVEEDIEMDEPTLPPPPKIKLRHTATSDGRPSKPMLVVTPAETGPLRSVEQKEADVDPGDEDEADEDDEEEDLSELNSEDEEQQQDETNLEEDGDGEGDGEDEEDVNGADELDDDEGDLDLDSEGMTPGSGAATPDLAKMTKRQRREDEGFMALDMAPQIKKHFTQEEQNMRRSEMARRRKNLSEKKVMEEKESTINKLLKKQTSKRRGANAKPETLAAAVAAEGAENESPGEETVEKANPLCTRWICDGNGVRLGVPEEWLGKHVGRAFGPPHPISSGRLIEEVD